MSQSSSTFLKEFIRCTRHNLLHLRYFHLSYKAGLWHVRGGQIEMVFQRNPFLAFRDIEGYVNGGRWLPEAGMTVVDAGGCYGEFALYAAKRVGPAGRVIMLEPDPANVEISRQLFALNGNPSNLQVVQAGLWSKPGRLRFNTGLDAQSAIASADTVASPGASSIEIQTHTLAGLAEAFDLKRLDFVKMDIEGAEVEAISAASQLPPRFKPRYAIASYHIVNGRRTADVLAEMFPKLGYHCRTGYPNHLTTWASPVPFD